MFRKIEAGRRPDERDEIREWYQSGTLDLFVWRDAAGAVTSFQLAYDTPHAEEVCFWQAGAGTRYYQVEPGDKPGRHPMSALLGREVQPPPEPLLRLFEASSGTLPLEIRQLIVNVLQG